jgi:hypothetical protein
MEAATGERVVSGRDPNLVAHEIRGMLTSTAYRAKTEAPGAEDTRAQALFETTAEVLQGLITAYEHFENQSEAAWGGGKAAAVSVGSPNGV